MLDTAPATRRLSELPLWRLIVELDDAERTLGAGSSTARALARALQDRLKGDRERPHVGGEVGRAG